MSVCVCVCVWGGVFMMPSFNKVLIFVLLPKCQNNEISDLLQSVLLMFEVSALPSGFQNSQSDHYDNDFSN